MTDSLEKLLTELEDLSEKATPEERGRRGMNKKRIEELKGLANRNYFDSDGEPWVGDAEVRELLAEVERLRAIINEARMGIEKHETSMTGIHMILGKAWVVK